MGYVSRSMNVDQLTINVKPGGVDVLSQAWAQGAREYFGRDSFNVMTKIRSIKLEINGQHNMGSLTPISRWIQDLREEYLKRVERLQTL